MSTIELLLQSFVTVLQPMNLLSCFIGVFLGNIVGILPGLGPGATLAILLPLIFGKEALPSVIMLTGIYYGTGFGGAITSITLNIPGENSSVPTCFDGYPLTKKGLAGKAIGIAVCSSFFGGLTCAIIITLIGMPLSTLALKFGPAEFFALYLFTFISIVAMMKGSKLKGLAAMFLGLLVSTIGLDVVNMKPRLTMGSLNLMRGVDFLPVAVGLFGLSEILLSIASPEVIKIKKGELKFRLKELFPTFKEIVSCLPTMLRSVCLGFVIGVMPGVGKTLASMLAYNMEERFASDRANFGKGSLQGVSAPETADNAASAGALVPLLTLGVPGSGTTAILMGALIMVGIRPGPGLFTRSPELVWGLISSMYIGNFMLFGLTLLMLPVFVWFLRVSQKTLPVIVAVLCVCGTFSAQNSLFDTGVMLFFAIIGLILKNLKFPLVAIVVACVLGNEMEMSFRQTQTLFRGNLGLFFEHPIVVVLFALSLVMIAVPLIGWIRGLKNKKEVVPSN